MPGRPLCTDAQAIARGYASKACARRRAVLRETLQALMAVPPHACLLQAVDNLQRWAGASGPRQTGGLLVQVVADDWGEVTRAMTQAHGTTAPAARC